MVFWRARASVDGDEQEWLAVTWRWLDDINGAVDGDAWRNLALPGRGQFPDTELRGHARAQYYFDLVRQFCDMSDWPCRLVPQREKPKIAPSVVFGGGVESKGAVGTFRQAGNAAVITYDPALLDTPSPLIATFAHELSHYRIRSAHVAIPGGWEFEELATDLCTVHLGFGLFGANAAFSFKQFTDFDRQGWKYQRQGYLSEPMWCYANAVFLVLTEVSSEIYEPFTKRSVTAGIKKNRAYLAANRAQIDRLRAVASN